MICDYKHHIETETDFEECKLTNTQKEQAWQNFMNLISREPQPKIKSVSHVTHQFVTQSKPAKRPKLNETSSSDCETSHESDSSNEERDASDYESPETSKQLSNTSETDEQPAISIENESPGTSELPPVPVANQLLDMMEQEEQAEISETYMYGFRSDLFPAVLGKYAFDQNPDGNEDTIWGRDVPLILCELYEQMDNGVRWVC